MLHIQLLVVLRQTRGAVLGYGLADALRLEGQLLARLAQPLYHLLLGMGDDVVLVFLHRVGHEHLGELGHHHHGVLQQQVAHHAEEDFEQLAEGLDGYLLAVGVGDAVGEEGGDVVEGELHVLRLAALPWPSVGLGFGGLVLVLPFVPVVRSFSYPFRVRFLGDASHTVGRGCVFHCD